MSTVLQKLQALIQPALNWCIRSEKHLLAALATAMAVGALLFVGLYVDEKQQKQVYQQQLQLLNEEQKLTLQSLAKANVSSAVNRNADYTLRKTLEQQQKTLDEQERLLEFYSLLMSLGQTKEGLELNGLTVTALNDAEPLQFSYQLVFVQYAKRHNRLIADISIKLLGTQNGEAKFINLKDLHQGGGEKDNKSKKSNKSVKQFGKLRFKYFQKMEGQLTLPVGFIPEQIVIDALIKKKKAKPWQRIVDWQAEE